jgi:hypothetical protein
MSLSSVISRVQAWATSPVVERAIKTFVEATAAQAALYTTVVPDSPGVKGSATISVGATVLSVVWNLLIAWATKAKSAKLDALAQAIDNAVDARLALRAAEQTTPRQQP